MLVVMTGLAGTGPPAAGYAAAAGTVLVLLAAAALAVTRAILRPMREAARLVADAGHGGGGRPGEVTARRPAADMAGHLEQACLQLRRPAAIVHGFTEYCRKHGRPPPAAFDQMMQRVNGEITRMETLVDGLDTRQTPASGDHAT
jgi:hypothetical protein